MNNERNITVALPTVYLLILSWIILFKLGFSISAFGISLTYEMLQFIFAIGASDITDLIGNTLGGVIGYVLVHVWSFVLKDKTHKMANRIATVRTVLIVILLSVLLGLNKTPQTK